MSPLFCTVTTVTPQASYDSSPVCKHETKTCHAIKSALSRDAKSVFIMHVFKMVLLTNISMECVMHIPKNAKTSPLCPISLKWIMLLCLFMDQRRVLSIISKMLSDEVKDINALSTTLVSTLLKGLQLWDVEADGSEVWLES